ncbi:isopentenyl-diphosphate delta-isomerase Fni [Paenibacillus larvae subsp. larvae]|nr:type 2 isopentenyl-diphosphate Delta-isomerase [Paenibacillus larvae]AQZ47866.1 type 2 isopentenyl-diphosphate Delta-isomerase [Paenibacillus larvae subsp. pulvifaciens]AVF25759.1 isopentenyl-diphosphate delta-isomerase Fni [Paenibacillus larvae subsp. larvae]AVF30536.1 isopentenyl-diphosphate delta-isomerase Fni [Paenibacillus larvae subsp. larvae]AVG11713.1 isopentenyl-diphosphate delta-isomerase Fni [Paenibacillus larvae subsp. larvae DSM 25430]MBH0341954.1 isopentenyl pyrophosphate isom
MRMSRKMEHVQFALELGQSGKQGFADLKFVHNCLPGTSVESIVLDTRIGDLTLSSPILINAMTGGALETEEINRELAIVSREKRLAMAVGSQMSAIKNKEVRSSYQVVRRMNPDGIIISNLGSEATPEQAEEAVDMLKADALQIHLNVMQELIMPEGDRSFEGALERISAIIDRVGVPVIVKEVGFGIMKESAARLNEIGVGIVDVAGSGGTNFAAIENARRDIELDWLNDWGGMTSTALLETLTVYPKGQVIASGGIRNSLDIVKALSLGASAVGMAGRLLHILKTRGTSSLIQYIEELEGGIKLVMTALGAKNIPALTEVPLVISGGTAEWCKARGIDFVSYARRGN